MYNLLKNMWVMNRITAEQVQSYVGKFKFTQSQADEIISTPQI